MMKSNYFCAGISYGVLFVAACNPSIVDPIAGGPDGRGGQSGEGTAGKGGEGVAGKGSEGVAGKGGEGVAGKGGEGVAGSSGAPGGGAGGGGAGGGGAGGGGAGGEACGALRAAAENAIETNRACTQDSDCEQVITRCLFPGNEACGDEYGISKTAHTEARSAYDAYIACAGQCIEPDFVCDPQQIAQCSQGVCLNSPGDIEPTACVAAAARATAEVGDAETCSLVARVDSVSLAITGHVLVCGPRNAVDEAGARASANAAVTFVSTGLGGGSGELLSGPAPSDVWLFKQIYGDFGHASAVSARSGQTLFWGQLDYAGNPSQPTLAGLRVGSPHAPIPWAKSELGANCYQPPALAQRDWDLRVSPSAVLGMSEPDYASYRVMGSAFVKGLAAKLPLTSLVTLHYGETNMPAPVSEYIVIVSAAR